MIEENRLLISRVGKTKLIDQKVNRINFTMAVTVVVC